MAIFDGVHYSLSPSLPPTRRNELAAVLDLNGAAPHPPYTHLIALSASHAHNNATSDRTVKLVADRWVDRSVVMGKIQPEQYYSPDPAMIFSGVVACATDLSPADLEVISAGVTALGGQWRIGLTRDVTHLFALRAGSDKYNTALHFASQTHMCILTPHWFDDAVRLGLRIPETPYAWPDPPVLRPGMILNLDNEPVTADGRRKRKPAGDTEADGTGVTNDGEHVRVWAGRRILLSTSLELGGGSRSAIEARIRRAGGTVVPITEDAEEDEEARVVDECDVLVTRWRSGKSYFKAARASLLIGNLSWLFSVESSGTLYSPLDSLLWYPTPRGGIPGLIDCEISITNYTGATRDYLKRLVILVGAKFTPSMSQSNKVLVAGFQPSPKTTRAHLWSIPVVNHTWLEDCFVEWSALTVGLERYIIYPPGVDFGKMLMTRRDGHPSSQSVSAPPVSGGAVPGGRGVGVIDVDLEESRDAEYRSHASKDRRILGLSTMQEVCDTTVDEVSMARLEDDGPPEPQARAPSQAGSVKKTPSSVKIKRGSVSTPMTASTTGAFSDHVIELPADDEEENERDKRLTLANGKRGARSSSAGSRAIEQIPSRPSVGGPSGTAKKTGPVVHDSKTRSGDMKDNEKGKGKGKVGSSVKDTGKPGTRPVQDAHRDKNSSRPVPKAQPRSVQPGSDARVEIEVEKQVTARTGKLRRQSGKMTIRSNSDLGSSADEGEGSEGSVPPRKVAATGSTTPIKSGMKPKPKSRSDSRPKLILSGESEDGGRATKPTRKGEVATKEKEGGKETEKVAHSPRSPAGSQMPKKRRLSVLIPSMPKSYFSSSSVGHVTEGEEDGSQDRGSGKKGADTSMHSGSRRKQLASTRSMQAIATEASTSASKRGRPSPAKVSTAAPSGKTKSQSKTKVKPKPGGSKVAKTHTDDDDEDVDELQQGNDASMIIDTPTTTTSRTGLRRSAANKATARLRQEVMPDVINFEKEQKLAKRRRSTGGESVTSLKGMDGERVERGGKRRKVAVDEEAEVEDVVSARSVKTKSKSANGKGKAKEVTTVSSDDDTDDRPVRNKRSESHDKGPHERERGSPTIRLMTTGLTLSDEVVKRLTKLGVQMTMKPTDCTHLVAKGIVRTEKFLCAMSVSPYVLTEAWANASAKGGKLLPENNYLLSDKAAEQKWSFKFADAIARAKGPEGGPSLFKQMTFYVTPKVSIDVKLLKNVISAGGGQAQTTTAPTTRILKGKANRYVVSCPEDKAIWRPLVQEGFRIYSPELVLRGALRQEIEWERGECVVAG